MTEERRPTPVNSQFTQMIDLAFEAHESDVVYGLDGSRSLTLNLPTELLMQLKIPHRLNQDFPENPSSQMYLTFLQRGNNGVDQHSGVRIEVFDLEHGADDLTWKMELGVKSDDNLRVIGRLNDAQAINDTEFGDIFSADEGIYGEFISTELLRLVNFEHYRNKIRLMLKDKVDTSGLQRIEKAFLIADIHHRGQFRDSGEPYIDHVFETARILAEECGVIDSDIISAAIAHDVLEDSEEWKQKAGEIYTEWMPKAVSRLADEIGAEAARIVGKVTRPKLDGVQIFTKDQANFIYKSGIKGDAKATLVKMADRLHNLRTLFHLSPERQINTIIETLNYIPIFEDLIDHPYYSDSATTMLVEMWKVLKPGMDKYFGEFGEVEVADPYWWKMQ